MMEFKSAGAFGAYLMTVAVSMRAAERHAMEDAALMFRDEARLMLGSEQTGAGGLKTWEPLSEFTQQRRVQLGYTADEPLLMSGTLYGEIAASWGQREARMGVPSKMVDDKSRPGRSVDIGDVAIWNEFGTITQEPRSFIALTGVRHGEQAVRMIGRMMERLLAGMTLTRYHSRT